MFRFVVLSALVAIAAAAPSVGHYESAPLLAYSAPAYAKTIVAQPTVTLREKAYVKDQYTVVEQPTVEHVGNVVKSFPSAVSHQSQTIVHNKASVVEPILAHGVQRSVVNTPTIEKQIIAEPGLQKTIYETPIATKTLIAAPVAHKTLTYSAPLAHTQLAYSNQLAYSSPLAYSAPLTYASHGSPLAYSNYQAW